MKVSDMPMVTLDFETTGTDPLTDRAVSFTAAYSPARGVIQDTLEFIVNPGIPVPDNAAAVHGITTERVQAEGVRARIAFQMLASFMETHLHGPMRWTHGQVPLVIYNARFDWPLLWSEMRRHGIALHLSVPIVDPLVLDRQLDKYRKGSRKLADVARHYGIALDNAHDAAADAHAALSLARVLTGRTDAWWHDLEPWALHRYIAECADEQQRSLNAHWERKGDPRRATGVWPWGDMAPSQWFGMSPFLGLWSALAYRAEIVGEQEETQVQRFFYRLGCTNGIQTVWHPATEEWESLGDAMDAMYRYNALESGRPAAVVPEG